MATMDHDEAPATTVALVLALPVDNAHAETRLAGLPLVTRAVLRLARAGARRIVVAIAKGDARARAALGDRRVPSSTSILEVADAREALRALADEGDPTLVVRFHAVAENGVYDALLRATPSGPDAVIAREGTPLDATPFVAGKGALARLARSADGANLGAALEALAREGALEEITTPGFVRAATDEVGRRFVFDALFEACRKSVDGIVSRHLNRHVSLFVSKRIVDTPITPNQMSVVTFALGVAAAVTVSHGTYATMLAGASLMQLNSILDGVDGELARVRFEQSKLGEWIDTVSDDLSNALFYGGLAIAATKLPAPGPSLAWLGAAAVVLQLLTMALYYAELLRLGRGDFYALGVGGRSTRARGLASAVVTAIGYATKKDFFIFAFLIAAAAGVLEWALVPIAVGTTLTFFAGVSLLLKRSFAGAGRRRGARASVERHQ